MGRQQGNTHNIQPQIIRTKYILSVSLGDECSLSPVICTALLKDRWCCPHCTAEYKEGHEHFMNIPSSHDYCGGDRMQTQVCLTPGPLSVSLLCPAERASTSPHRIAELFGLAHVGKSSARSSSRGLQMSSWV